MRTGIFGSSLLAIALLLSGCDKTKDNQDQAGVALEDMQWSDEATDQLNEALAQRAAHGLDQKDFGLAGSGEKAGNAELTKAALAYAQALARGATDPTKLYEIYTVPRPSPDLRAGLAQALREGKVGAWLASLAPQDASYRKLSETYLALRKQGNGASTEIPATSAPLKPGESDPRIPAIVRQLVATGYLDKANASTDTRYTPAIAAAVRAMQADYGITADGVIGDDALKIINLSDADRARAIAVNMERMRWLERTPPATRIDVNIAAARQSYWRDGKLADVRRVIVGEPDRETPMLGSPIYRLVANPTWTVPRSIEEKELAGKGADYLRRNNMARKDGWIVQQPGPKNSLGLVKFDMKNDHAIYLHDTPAKQLFDDVQRQRSHGCVRVQDALGFADMIARDEGVAAEWQKARETGKESFVPLPREIPVRLLYQTVIFDDAGDPVVRDDPYGWNNPVTAALGFGSGSERRVRGDRGDIGP
ncbi:murein L,D-transpeptidase YcbB/YkuD [Sphingobium sp. B11D3B]|uniref:L,D-transpeptidase family protein n=1 Tax=Sphingobium sp. B11D3B TaxID=2940575 RepID=UPI0022267BBB|nr:L,D-transpeptidase family protein [Sphingobium sp. B11D3B]MCW2387292.1 murein L,D-transpeptidase YcbB/YkuD [Sphingobium sp. B11D3B]